jgi:hypothetical protein
LECRKGRCGTHSKLNKLSLVKKAGKFVGMQEKGFIYKMVSGFPVKVEVPKEAAFTYEGVSPTSSVLTVVRVGDCDTVERSGAAAQFDVRREVSP